MGKKLTVLMILDGYGQVDTLEGNAIKTANKPNIDNILANYPFELGYASGMNVGLPDGQMGNSEVGHLNIGAGRIVYQELTRITKSVEDGDFFEKQEFLNAVDNCKRNDTALHLMGLLSDGGVHSHIEHLYALLELAKRKGLTKVYVHAFLDGRDTSPTSGKLFLDQLEKSIKKIGVGEIATISGRYYAMDRDKRYERVQLAYDALVLGKGDSAENSYQCIESSYEKGITDEFVLPTIIMKDGMPTATIKQHDSVIFFNFRPDRAREITRCFCDGEFNEFERKNGFMELSYICMTEYDTSIQNKEVAFKPQSLDNTLGEYISKLGLKQLRLAETEKYAHVTFFFNGGVEKEYVGEDRILIRSPKVATYDLQPEMSAYEITDALVKSIKEEKYDLIIVNYANPDMVGHTGIFDAAIKAIETVDECLGRVIDALLSVDGQMFICADHGNSDKMIDYDTKEAFTAHSTNPVPFALVNCKEAKGIRKEGRLCDIAPTLLDIMNVEIPKEMTGQSLIIRN